MKSKLDIPIKVFNILGDIILISYLFLINMEYWFSLVSAMTIVLAIKIICQLIITKNENKYLFIAVTIITFIVFVIIEIILIPDNIFAFTLLKIPAVLYLITFAFSLTLSIIKNKTSLIK